MESLDLNCKLVDLKSLVFLEHSHYCDNSRK